MATADDAFITSLKSEVTMLRGIGGLSGPVLDHEGGTEEAGDMPGVEALERVQYELQEMQEAQQKREAAHARTALQEALDHTGDARTEREGLLAYMEDLRQRDDSTGSAIRGNEFEQLVDDLTAKGDAHSHQT